MDRSLYGPALFLNQGKFYPIMKRGDDELVGELRGCFSDVLGKMIEDEEIQNKINQQVVLYENQRGPFSIVTAMQNIGTRNPCKCFKFQQLNFCNLIPTNTFISN